MRVRVDEPRRHDELASVDLSRAPARHRADLGDAAAGDGEITGPSRGTSAVDHEATADHEVVRHENASFGPVLSREMGSSEPRGSIIPAHMEDIYCFAGNPLDRVSARREDKNWIAALLADPGTRSSPCAT